MRPQRGRDGALNPMDVPAMEYVGQTLAFGGGLAAGL